MNLNPIRQNMTELELRGLTILFSYKTPVACVWTNGSGEYTMYKTSKKWSNTTTRHINDWRSCHILRAPVEERPQEYFDSLSAEVK